MELEIKKPNSALTISYFKQSLSRAEMDLFKKNLTRLFSRINESESEEHNKNIVSAFLTDTFYKTDYEINTAQRKDLVIHLGKTSATPVAVIIEAKRPDDKAGMITATKPNAKAIHELIHYYLHERCIKDNKDIRNLIITDIYQWYIFDASEFERLFFNNKTFVKNYKDWNDGVLPAATTDWFYQEIAKPFLDKDVQSVECTYFNLREYQSIIENDEATDDSKLIHLYKVLSPQHLLKLPFANDSNTLNRDFYNELLHILGLEESKSSGKNLIERKSKNRNAGSLLENAINTLIVRNKMANLEQVEVFGESEEEQLFSVALELCITWLNRILFLKLLEGQLIKYHKGSRNFAFLNSNQLQSYHELDELFFEVLAIKPENRTEHVSIKFGDLPYLNSSLFERTDLEHKTIQISELKVRLDLPIFNSTVLKDSTGKRIEGNKNTLEYLYEFLDSYNFSSDSTAQIQEEAKTIINAAVLGLIFEKINGYKDGSFYTPSFITTYMCKETLRKSVVQKFKNSNLEGFKNVQDFEDLKDKLDFTDTTIRKKANEIVNSIKICDPAVGSGHFLVAALNEMIAIKSELQILSYTNGKRIREYRISNENDELSITDKETEEAFGYVLNEKNRPIDELQLLQESLFYEKRMLIEKCLFGVDINPKSVHICRLRLWIELLKNAYYTRESNYNYLETLPNIDINIKTGNSLISKFDLTGTGLKNGQLQKIQQATQKYKDQVIIYKSTNDKKVKQNVEKEIARLKQEFARIANPIDEDYIQLQKIEIELSSQVIHFSQEDVENWKIRQDQLVKQKEDLEHKYKEKLYSIYGNAFEWRFEFPEVLDENGNFVGFDVVIANPPYINVVNLEKQSRNFYQSKYVISKNKVDLFAYFIELAAKISNPSSDLGFIIPHTWKATDSFSLFRKFLVKEFQITDLVNLDFGVFHAVVKPMVMLLSKPIQDNYEINIHDKDFKPLSSLQLSEIKNDKNYVFDTENSRSIKNIFAKIEQNTIPLESVLQFTRGIKTSDDNRFLSSSKVNEEYKKVYRGRNIKSYQMNWANEWIWYRPDLMREKVGCLPHSKELFEVKEKLVMQRVNSSMQLLVAYDTEMNYFLDTTNVSRYETLNKNYSMKFVLALLNSKLINFWYCNKFRMPTIGIYEIHSIPIKEVAKKEQTRFIKLVDKLLTANDLEVNQYKKQIDELVYQLYELSSEEIQIVEKSL